MGARKAPTCRFCGSSDGELRRVPMDGDSLRCLTRTNRAMHAKLDRLNPTVEHPACLVAAEQEQARYRSARRAAVEAAKSIEDPDERTAAMYAVLDRDSEGTW